MNTLAAPDEPGPRHRTAAWLDAGFMPQAAAEWQRLGCGIAAATAWRDAGGATAAEAGAWLAAGTTPATVGPALRSGMTPPQLARWREVGYSLDEAIAGFLAGSRPVVRIWHQRLLHPFRSRPRPAPASGEGEAALVAALTAAKVPPPVLRAYVDAGWSVEDAAAWAVHVQRPVDAVLFRLLGLDPASAAGLGEVDASQLVADWWESGLPREHVAAWLLAGFSPAEATEAERQGSTVEQAKVLRAFRR